MKYNNVLDQIDKCESLAQLMWTKGYLTALRDQHFIRQHDIDTLIAKLDEKYDILVEEQFTI